MVIEPFGTMPAMVEPAGKACAALVAAGADDVLDLLLPPPHAADATAMMPQRRG